MNKRIIAINLPQFHPFKENEEWWGKGFTEWTNVTKAKPRFKGHYQPHLPTDTGFYDLRLPEAREMQAEMARKYGIYGFCYYHYWFNGKLLMERPLREIVESGNPDFPFMICWANENWSRAWDGSENEILIEQSYSAEDDKNHINYLLDNIILDKRYIKIDGKPIIAIYKSTLFPNIKSTIQIWRDEARLRGIELYICRFESFNTKGEEYLKSGFDAAIEFQPQTDRTEYLNSQNRKIKNIPKVFFRKFLTHLKGYSNLHISYEDYINYMISRPQVEYKRYPCVMPMWDNSARKVNNYMAFLGSTPELYKKWLSDVYYKFKPYSKEENLIFINAWNEWAEGNHLEPDLMWGRSYLEKTKEVIMNE